MKGTINTDSVFEKVFNNFKKVSPALLAVAIATALILFLPKEVLSRMALDDLPNVWKTIIGIVFIVSVALLLTIIITKNASKFATKRSNIKLRKHLENGITKLSPGQKQILITALNSPDKRIRLDPFSGDVAYLENNLYLHKMETYMFVGPGYNEPITYAPEPWLLELFNEKPELFH